MKYTEQAAMLAKQEDVINHQLGVIKRNITVLNRKNVYGRDEMMRMHELKERQEMFERLKADSKQLNFGL